LYYTIDATSGATKKVPLSTPVKNASGEKLILSNHGKFSPTNLTSLNGKKVYKKIGSKNYYTKTNTGAMTTLMMFSPTNLTSLNGKKVYEKVGLKKYYTKTNTGAMTTLMVSSVVKNAAGKTMTIANYKKKGATPKPVTNDTKNLGAGSNLNKVQKALINKAPVPAGWTNTGKLSNNGKKVYKLGQNFGVLKNGKMSKTFKGKAKLVKQQAVASVMAPSAPAPVVAVSLAPVVAVSLVPVIRPGPDHVKAIETKYVNSVTKVAEKLKELHEATGGTNTTNFNNYVAKRGNMGFVHMNRMNTVIYRTTSVEGFHGASRIWKQSLDKPKFIFKNRSVMLKYTQYLAHKQLLLVYGKNVNSFENVRMSDIIDTKWLVAQDKYIRSLSSRQLFTMFGYSHRGDSWAHAYLDGKFSMSQFKSGVPTNGSSDYFAFFFQARDYYKINTGDAIKDYPIVLNRVRDENNVKNIENIMNMFINELNEIIRKAPAVTRTFIVFRGQKDDRYMSGMIGNTYTTERFCSTSIDGSMSAENFSDSHTLQRITILRGSKCLLMFGTTKFDKEFEILLPRGSTYQIVKKRTNVKSYKSTNLLNPGYPTSIQNLVDIVLVGSVQEAPASQPVPVTVIPQTNVNVMRNIVKKQHGWSLIKVTGLIGKGGYGAVYQASDPNFGNLAIKIQKKSNNSNAEVKALKKLKHSGIAPNYYNNKLIKANNNIAKLVPKGVAPGNNVSIMVSQMIRGTPLKKWYTGAPLPQNIKNKVTNVVSNMHKKGVIHGDLHKNNILIGNNGKAYVIDFGKSLVTNKSFKTTNEANNYLKKLTGKTKTSHSKVSWYSNNKRTHFLNGNFLRRMT
jgi:predicted Ser/Thr protein kinase